MKRSHQEASGPDSRREPPAGRRGGGSQGGDPGVPRTRFAFKVLITDGLTSTLLGKRCALRDEIQNESGTRLVFSNKGDFFPQTQFRVLGIYADETPRIFRALELIMDRVVELGDAELAHPPPGGPELLGKEAGEYIFRICLSRQTAGFLIGSGGSNVKQLRADTGAKIFIDNDTVMEHRLIRVIGSPSSVLACLDQVNEYVQRGSGTEEFLQYARLVNFGEAGAADGATGPPRGGAYSSDRPSGHGGRGGAGGGGGGGAPQRPAADRRVVQAVDDLGDTVASLPPGTAALSYSIMCTLPAHLVGALVGKGGDFVKHVEKTTGTQVDITQGTAAGSDSTRTMSIVGTLLGTYSAHAMMLQRLKDIESRDPPAGPSSRSRRGEEDHHGGDMGRPEELRASIAELQRQLEEVKGRS